MPGHDASVDALVAVLSERGRFAVLADALTEQAHKLESRGRGEESGALWSRVATLVEQELGDPDRAIGALGRVVELAPSNLAYDDLARLHLTRDESVDAAIWLQKRLETTDEGQRVAVLLRLARAQIQAEQDDAATASLSAAFSQAPRNGEVRKLLLGLYRRREAWEPLARTLAIAAEHVGDTATILAYARESAEIYNERLDQPDQAVPVLERAHALAPEDRRLRSRLAEGLRVAGRLDEARELLTGLVSDFGRRRSPDRAKVHLQIARVAHAQGDNSDALDHLERASKMDSANPTIMRTLAELARETGQYDRAERAYRALLLQVRRQTGDQLARDRIGASEVLIELSAIAAERGQTEQAEELVESALEALAASDDEAARVQQLLYERGDYELLRRVFQTQLSHAEGPRHRATILGLLADLEQRHLDHAEQALTLWLEAVDAAPGIPELHDQARASASDVGEPQRYVALLETLLDKARRNTDIHVRCELLLRMAETMVERSDLDQAQSLLDQAAETGAREIDVWRARAKLAGAQGDKTAQMQLLKQLAELGEDESETRADALYRIAEVQLASEESLADGIESLQRALSELPRPDRAVRILRRATEDAPMEAELLELFDRVARTVDDPTVMLLAIERRAQHPDTAPEYIREGVELASAAGEHERADALMARAVEVGANVLDGATRISWALLGLARRRHQEGDLAGAVKWLREAAESAQPQELFALGREIATAAAQDGGDPSLAAKLYETLLERDPTAREAWEPLAALYRRLGDVERLHRLVDETLDGLGDTSERNALRLSLAESQLDAGNTDAALEILRGVLLEDPEHETAQRILAEHLEKSGRHEELDELLAQQLLAAQSRSDIAAVTATALKLGQRLGQRDPDKAIATLRTGLEVAPDDPELVAALLQHLQGEDRREDRIALLERIANGADVQDAERLGLELADLYQAAGDNDGMLRALAQSQRRAPTSAKIRARLQQAYEDGGDYRGVAQLLTAAAESEPDLAEQVDLLRRAATIHREQLSDPDTSATLLEDAHRRAPDNAELALELASGLAAAGKTQDACDMVAELLGGDPDDVLRLQLLMMRGDLLNTSGDLDGAIADYETALALDATDTTPGTTTATTTALIAALRSKLDGANAVDNTEAERAATLRLVEVLLEDDSAQDARELLEQWVERARKDTDALQLLRRLDEKEERWDAVVKTCGRLVAVETGESQAEAAVALAEACEHLGKPQDARPGLEHARRKQPEHRGIRQQLQRIYEQIGADHELARLLVHEADETEDEAERLTLLRRIAEIHNNAGDVEGALPILQEVVQLAPDDLHAAIALADAFTALGELDAAERIIDQGLEHVGTKRTPELAALSHRKARIAGARGDATAQLALLQKAFAADKTNPQVAAELADLAEAVEEYDLAVKVLRTITLLDDCAISRVEAFLRQAKIAFKRDDRQRAVLWARKARHEAPDSAEVAAFLEELGD
ncbi:MAG: tetratricopeptide repeat protein [Nannocystaceae bacterium]|nr:tetratricopeptide repeat protein [Nannocystaceae bacterium]